MQAYTGADFPRWYGRAVIDMTGFDKPAKLPILLNHEDGAVVGFADEFSMTDKGLELKGVMSAATEEAKRVAQLADEGYPWTCSVGVELLNVEKVTEGSEAKVNGRLVTGPIDIWRKTRLFECSFVTCNPADKSTAAEVMRREETMADLKDAPVATEILRAEAAKLAREELKARADELAKAFPTRVEFARKCAIEGKSVIEAKASLADEIEGELEKLKKLVERPLEAHHPKPEVATLKGYAGPGFDAGQRENPGLEGATLKLSPEERAKQEWHQKPEVRMAFPDVPALRLMGGGRGVDSYASWLRFESRLAQNDPQKRVLSEDALKDAARRLGAVPERLSSWGKSGPDYADMTVKGFIGTLYRALETSSEANWAPRIGTMVPSNQETETYRFMGQYPMFREWLGSRQVRGMPVYSTTVTNKLFEATVGFDINDFKFDKSGQIQIRMGDAGQRASRHWEKLASAALESNGTAFDSVAFFATTHTLGGDSGTMSNLLTSTSVAALAVAVPTSPTRDEFSKAIVNCTQQFYGYKDDKGEPINDGAGKFVVMVSPNLHGPALEALRSERLTQGGSNSLAQQDVTWDVVKNPRLTTTKTFYIFREDVAFKALILQEASGVEVEFQAAGSDEAFKHHRYLYGMKTTRNVGYGDWANALSCTFS